MGRFAVPLLLVLCTLTIPILELCDSGSSAFRALKLLIESTATVLAVSALMRAIRRARFSREITQMLRRIRAGNSTKRFYFQHAIGTEDTEIAGAFSEAMKSIYQRFESILQERMREEAIIGSMGEGVVVVDTDQRITRMNEAALELLGIPSAEVVGRTIPEVVRNAEFQRFVTALLAAKHPEYREVELLGGPERHLQLTGRELKDIGGRVMGGIIVVSDITRLRRLERTRKDFIANVSHELKTPVTSIRGFAETLLDGALENPEDARRFLTIISRQAERLSMIFDDMLALSRLEQERSLELKPSNVEAVIKVVVQSCELKASSKKITLDVHCPPALSALMNSAFAEQAVLNLVDNAIKYSPEGSHVQVRADRVEGSVFISVQDNGPGIEAQHHPRIFERFYRVDKGRTRSEGGTGLGLAIVKHIAQIHGGYATVESAPGRGSTFTVFFKSAPGEVAA